MKRFFIGGYFAIAMISWLYLSNWGDFAFKGAAYNLGRALVWPVIAFPAFGQLVGALLIGGLVLFSILFMRSR